MPRNVYFSQTVRSEQHLYEDLIIESLKIYGQDVYYLPRTIVSRDDILGEDRASKFDDAYMIEAYIENTDGFEGAGDLYSKFGLEIRDESTFIISRRQWNKLIGLWNNGIYTVKPLAGDLIYLPLSNNFFEIMMVEDEQPFYQLSNLPVWKLQCSLFEYNDEDFETGVDVIDAIQSMVSYQISVKLSVIGGNHLAYGETVTQQISDTVSVYGEVQAIDKVSNIAANITLSNIGVTGSTTYHDFIVSDTIGLVGSESGNTCYINTLYTVADADDNFIPNDAAAQNSDFEIAADGILDFSETNPFGDASETY